MANRSADKKNSLFVWCMMAMCMLAAAIYRPVLAETIGIAATVNESVITTTDVTERREMVMTTSNIPATPENIQHITPRIIQSLIDEALELQDAKRQSLTVTPEEIEKAINEMPASRNQPPGGLKKQFAAQGLSYRSLEDQVKAQLAWNKVVQRKLRRNVIISQDELVRAQQSEANAPDINEAQLTAIILPLSPDKAAKQDALAKEIGAAFEAGQNFNAVAQKYNGRAEVKFNPPVWVLEENLSPEVQQALQNLKPGAVATQVHTRNAIQFIQLLDRRRTKKPAASTEVTIKQITVELPAKQEKTTLAKMNESEQILRSNPGSCEDTGLPPTPLHSSAIFARLTMGNLTTEQRSILARLDVGGVSDALVTPDKMRLILLCERSESTGNARDMENLRQQLFGEKIELEAQKHLRDLRREASIDIRGEK